MVALKIGFGFFVPITGEICPLALVDWWVSHDYRAWKVPSYYSGGLNISSDAVPVVKLDRLKDFKQLNQPRKLRLSHSFMSASESDDQG